MGIDVKMEQAIQYCLNSGATVGEAATKFGVDRAKLNELLSQALNPNGGGNIGDLPECYTSEFYGDTPAAQAELRINNQKFNIVAVGMESGRSPKMRIYDSQSGEEIPLSTMQETFHIKSFTMNENGQINVVVYDNAPKMMIGQSSDNPIDKLKNLWDSWRNADNKGVVITAKSPEPGAVNGGVNSDLAKAASDYGVTEQYADIYTQLRSGVSKLSDEQKQEVATLAEAVVTSAENGDTEGVKEASNKLQQFIMNALPELHLDNVGQFAIPDEVVIGCLVAVAAIGISVGAEAGFTALASKVASSGAGKVAAMMFATAGLSSCAQDEPSMTDNSKNETNLDVGVTLTVTQQVNQIDTEALTLAFKEALKGEFGNLEKLLGPIIEGMGGIEDNLTSVVELVTALLARVESLEGKVEQGNQNTVAILEAVGIIAKDNEEFQAKVLEFLNTTGADVQTIITLLETINNDTGKMDAVLGILEEIKSTGLSQDAALKLLVTLGEKHSEQLDAILTAVKDGSIKLDSVAQLLAKIQNQDEKFQETVLQKFGEITDLLNNMKNADDDFKQNVLAIFTDITNSTENIEAKLDAFNNLVNQIRNENKEYQNKVLSMLQEHGDILYDILTTAQGSDAKLDAIAQLLAKIQGQDETFQKNVLEMLKNVGGGDYTEILNKILEAEQANGGKLDGIAQLLAKMQNQDATFQQNVLKVLEDLGANATTVLNEILAGIGDNNKQLKDITQLLAKIDSNVEKYGEDAKALGQQILEAINKFGADISDKLTQILEAANKSSNNGKNIMDLLSKVLEKLDTMDANQQQSAKDIIEAISNIKIDGDGNVNLTTIEAMLKDLIQLTSKNNGLLESIDGKMDVINLTIQAAKDEILAKMDASDANTTAILNALNEFKNISSANDKEILAKMDTIINVLNNIKDNKYDDTALMAKLDEILAAIKDHNITVDVTGKVECNCNCGQPHEGIIGDLEDILG